MHRVPAALLAASLLTAGCGYIGGPQAPLANVPTTVSDLAAVQRGAVIIVHFSVPTKTTENFPIRKPLKLDLRIGAASEPFHAEEWAARAKPITAVRIDQGIAGYEIPIADWIGKEATIAVRAIGANGKQAGWSNHAVVRVVATPEAPSEIKPGDVPAGVRLTWAAHGDHFRVLRRAPGEDGYTVVATVDQHEWTDTSTEYDKLYSYELQTLVDIGGGKVAESDLSKPVSHTPKDTFPPAVPSGLRAVPAANSIELAWDVNTEPDLAGYRIYRATGDGPFEKFADGGLIPSYSDTAIEHGKQYRYAVAAFDKAGNESQRSGAVAATLQ